MQLAKYRESYLGIKFNTLKVFHCNNKRDMPVKKEIAYPIFLECCPYTTDSFWANVFEDLAYGKAPYGTYISKDFLCCSYRKKSFSYKIRRKDPNQVYEEVYSLLSKKLGLLSPQDRVQQKKVFTELEAQMKYSRDSWSSIRKKNIKELLIEIFVIRMKNMHALSLQKSRDLLALIFMAMVFKVITSEDICYNNGKIDSINGIRFEQHKVIIERNLHNLDGNIVPRIVVAKSRMSENWAKYLKFLRNSIL